MPALMPASEAPDPQPGWWVPRRPTGAAVYPVSIRYTVKVSLLNGISIHFHPKPDYVVKDGHTEDEYASKDRGLDIRVLQNTRVEILLENDPMEARTWYFPDTDDVVAFKESTNPQGRYRNLDWGKLTNGRHGMISFDVDYRKDQPPLTDKFNIKVCIPQLMADGKTPDKEDLVLIVDPGIKNPGDDP